jgi:hypothetical protein
LFVVGSGAKAEIHDPRYSTSLEGAQW